VDRTHLLALLLLMRLAALCEVSSEPFARQPSFGQRGQRQSVSAPSAEVPGVSVAPEALPDPPAPRPSAKPVVDATQEALLEAAARTARMRRAPPPPRRGSKRAEAVATNAPEARPTPGMGAAEPPQNQAQPSVPAPQQTLRPDYAKAHLKELIARRKQAAAAAPATTTAAVSTDQDSGRELREARALLLAQQHGRAEKLLEPLAQREPNDDVIRAYLAWARWRAQPEASSEAQADELRDLAKKLLSETEHAGFASYMLGHLFLHAKRDDLAEKFFRRAHTVDRNNRDAHRHLMILERRKSGADASAANRKIFGIQISGPKKPS